MENIVEFVVGAAVIFFLGKTKLWLLEKYNNIHLNTSKKVFK